MKNAWFWGLDLTLSEFWVWIILLSEFYHIIYVYVYSSYSSTNTKNKKSFRKTVIEHFP